MKFKCIPPQLYFWGYLFIDNSELPGVSADVGHHINIYIIIIIIIIIAMLVIDIYIYISITNMAIINN